MQQYVDKKMDEFQICLNPGIRPTQFRFVYNQMNDTWHVWQYDEIQEIDLVSDFNDWPPALERETHPGHSDLIAKINLKTAIKSFTFKIYFSPINSTWFIWMRDENEGKDYLSYFTPWPPA